jgi:predicted CXXCH cytochrome family protein
MMIGGFLLSFGCSREDSPAPVNKPEAAAGTLASNASASATSLPQIGGPNGYVGSKSCRECHEDQHESWYQSYHRTMTQTAGPASVKADFHNVTLTNDNTRFTLTQKNDEFWVRMERLLSGTPGEPPPGSLEVPIGLVTGSHHMQVFWVADDTHNCQIGFPFTWLIPERRWVPRSSTFLRPPSLKLPAETWNLVCARCHATGSQPNLDRGTMTWHTQVTELGISCEACHGPAERHVSLQRQAKVGGGSTNLAIVHPKKIDPIRASQICGYCHSMKHWDRNEGWPERGFSFRPGDDLEATTPIMRPKQLDKQPWLAKALQSNPDIFRDFFWSDGMIRVSGREYNGLIESPCYSGAQFSCLSCHSLHNSDPDDQLARNRKDNQACTQCHTRFREELAVTTHTHHLPDSSGSSCYNCHMPHTTYGVLKAIRSHQISNPEIASQLATGRPNACNLCHLDKPLAWTADHLTRWYGHTKPQLSPDQTEVADSVRLALAGDAGQRALMAWHLSWEPAVQGSGKDWIPPILARLLDDPYAAVRCVAERSLRQAGNFLPADYDYTQQIESRRPFEPLVVELWSKELSLVRDPSLPLQTLVRRNDSISMRTGFERLTRQRDERPVRLRE